MSDIPETMRAAALTDFDGPEGLTLHELPVPEPDEAQVLIRVHTAGVGVWDPAEMRGQMRDLADHEPTFPYIPGSDASGTVVAVGDETDGLRPGDRVHAVTFLNPKGGAYAEYVAVDADLVAPVPQGLDLEAAGALPVDGVTALRGLQDTLKLQAGESLVVFGASGGVGHLAVQLAERMGARVLAVASGEDGVTLVKGLGADAAVDGKDGDVEGALEDFAPEGVDAVLACAHDAALVPVLHALRHGGRVAWPHGVRPEPTVPEKAEGEAYNGEAGPDILEELDRLIRMGDFRVHVGGTWPLAEAADAVGRVEEHHLGKLALRVGG